MRENTILFIFRDEFPAQAFFCWFHGRDIILSIPCENGWNPNFVLYWGAYDGEGIPSYNLPSEKIIVIYKYLYHRENRFSTNLFLRNDVD